MIIIIIIYVYNRHDIHVDACTESPETLRKDFRVEDLHGRVVARWRREVVIVTFKSARDRKRPADSGGFRWQTVAVAVNSVTSRG